MVAAAHHQGHGLASTAAQLCHVVVGRCSVGLAGPLGQTAPRVVVAPTGRRHRHAWPQRAYVHF
eukprot:8767375-Alexandrium_andersonii.AAC.1